MFYQLVSDHANEIGWEAVRLSRPNMRPWTGVRFPIRPRSWHDVVMFSRLTNGRFSLRSVQTNTLILIKRGSKAWSPHAVPSSA